MKQTLVHRPRLLPNDPGYAAVLEKRFNKRFSARPDYIQRAGSTEEVISAVQEAVKEGRRLVVTSGGHCLEGFVSDPDVRVILDLSPMKRVYYDPGMGAVAVEAGATVGQTFEVLYRDWGTVVPLGEYPAIGMGGHVAGGAFGFLCRQLGLAADYLYAVEAVTVDLHGLAGSVVATREESDPNRELWWAHTGGGGGNFGVVTRYWFRSLDAGGENPQTLLPRAPRQSHHLQGRMELERRGPPQLSPPPAEPRDLVRAQQRLRLSQRVALDLVRDPSQAVRQDHHTGGSAPTRTPNGSGASIWRQ